MKTLDKTSLALGQVHEVMIQSLAYGGSGVARVGSLVLFVPFTIPGEKVSVRITSVKKKYALADLLQVLHASPDRREPACRHFRYCGGCQYQHLPYDRQVRAKQSQVNDLYARIGRIPDPPVQPPLSCPQEYHYRIKAEFHWQPPVLGFMGLDGKTTVTVDRCEIVDETLHRQFTAHQKKLSGPPLDTASRSVTLWSSLYPVNMAAVPRFIARKVKQLVFNVPFNGFFQVNPYMTEALIDTVLRQCRPAPGHTVLDCYCGCGLFSLFLAARAAAVTGIEQDRETVYAARLNAKNHGIKNIHFIKGQVEKALTEPEVTKPAPYETVLLDPPRTGCSRAALQGLMALKPVRFVYVSCDPATQARDVAIIMQEGYRLKEIQPLDMFPQTKHIEVVTLLEKAE